MSVVKIKNIKPIKENGLLVANPVYKPFRYPWCYDAWLTQQRIHWLPEEVPLGDDVRDWQKTLSGSYNVRNKYLSKVLEKYGKDTDKIWSSITTSQGSVSHLDFLTKEQKEVFKTAFEINQNWIIELGSDRTPNISQAQSINIFVPADVHKRELHQIHFQAWKKGLKSLYYCRSKSIQRAENINSGSSTDVVKNVYSNKKESENDGDKYEECLSCQ